MPRIEKEYKASLLQKSINSDLRIDIKNYCENLRSVLDYLSREIRDKYCPEANTEDRLYFPIYPDVAQFRTKMSKAFPDLESNCKPLYDYLESIQPYKNYENKWLSHFNKLNNENKHDKLVEQVKTETKRINVNIQEGGSVNWDPSCVKFGSGVYIGGVPVNPATQMPQPHPSQQVTIVTWVDFKFSGLDVSALWLLKESLKKIKDIVSAAKKYIG